AAMPMLHDAASPGRASAGASATKVAEARIATNMANVFMLSSVLLGHLNHPLAPFELWMQQGRTVSGAHRRRRRCASGSPADARGTWCCKRSEDAAPEEAEAVRA